MYSAYKNPCISVTQKTEKKGVLSAENTVAIIECPNVWGDMH